MDILSIDEFIDRLLSVVLHFACLTLSSDMRNPIWEEPKTDKYLIFIPPKFIVILDVCLNDV